MDYSYFDFIMYLAFETALAFENKRELTISQLHNYRLYLLKEANNYFGGWDYFDDEEFKIILMEFIECNTVMTQEEEKKLLFQFLEENSMFYMDGDKIILRGEISEEIINEAKFELESYNKNRQSVSLCSSFIDFSPNLEGLKVLGLNTIKEELLKLYTIESNIEEAYLNYSDINNKNIISLGQMFSMSQVKGYMKKDYDQIGKYHRIVTSIINSSTDEYEMNLISDEILANNKFYLNNDYIDYVLDNEFQQAIFGINSLAWEKILTYFDNIEVYKYSLKEEDKHESYEEDDFYYEEDEIELEPYEDEYDNENIAFDDEEESEIERLKKDNFINTIFYLKYIEEINKYQTRFGSNDELQLAKSRLLYLLDRFGYSLFIDEELDKQISSISMKSINYKKDLHDFYVMSRLFLTDITGNEIIDDLTFKKMLFVSTYYSLTKDKRINLFLEKHKDTPIGMKTYDAIINNHINTFAPIYKTFKKKQNNPNN